MIYLLEFEQTRTTFAKRGEIYDFRGRGGGVLATWLADTKEGAAPWVQDGKILVEFDTEAGTATVVRRTVDAPPAPG